MPHLLFAIFFVFTLQAVAQAPRFEDYPVHELFQGTPAAPILIEPWMRMYRTKVREGVSKGYGVTHYSGPDPKDPGKEEDGPGPNFAGQYFVIHWGCGSDCIQMAIADGKTGKVYPPPLSHGKDYPAMLRRRGYTIPDGANYRLDSKLFVMETCDWDHFKYYDTDSRSYLPCTLSYFIIGPSGFELVDSEEYETPL